MRSHTGSHTRAAVTGNITILANSWSCISEIMQRERDIFHVNGLPNIKQYKCSIYNKAQVIEKQTAFSLFGKPSFQDLYSFIMTDNFRDMMDFPRASKCLFFYEHNHIYRNQHVTKYFLVKILEMNIYKHFPKHV